MKKELFKIFWENAKSTYPEGTSKHTNAILEEDFEKVWSEILDLISIRKTEEKLKEVFEANEPDIDSKMDKDKLKLAVASEIIIVAMETKGKRPTQLNFEEMIDVVADVVNQISANPLLSE